MSDKTKTTVRIQRPAKIRTDGRGRSVWTEPVETAEFELFSTLALKKILESKDEPAKRAIEAMAESGDEGFLARDATTGLFEIINDTDLQAILDNDLSLLKQEKGADVSYKSAYDSEKSLDDWALVSTMALRKILGKEEKEKPVSVDTTDSGFDPYNSS